MANNDWINKVIEDTMQGKQFKRRIQSGIDHLQEKKLYKYYSLSSEFTIPNIKNGTIYLQNPILFNDPFDCNIGMSVNQLIRALMPDFFDKILPDTNTDVRDALSAWMFGSNAPELEEGSAEHLSSICSSSPAFVKLLEKAKNGQDVSDQEILSLVVEDPTTFSEMIKAYLTIVSRGDTISFDNMAMQQVIKSPQIIRGLITSVAEIKDSRERQVLELLTSKDDFIEKIKSIAALTGVEVPKSEIERVYSSLDDGIRQIREGLGKQVGIECFTQSPTDILMLGAQEERDYGRHQNDVAAWQAERDYLAARYDNERNLDHSKYIDERNFAYNDHRSAIADQQWEDSFDYQQERDQIADQQWQDSFDYQKGRDQVSDQQWQDAFDYQQGRDQVADQQWEDSFEYQQGRDQVADQQWQDSFNHQQSQDQIANQQWQDAFDYQKGQDNLDNQYRQDAFDWEKSEAALDRDERNAANFLESDGKIG